MVFLDEIDAFLRTRASGDHAALGNMKAEFMALWDGLKDTAGAGLNNDINGLNNGLNGGNAKPAGDGVGGSGSGGSGGAGGSSSASGFGVVVVGATNRPWDVDPAIQRRMPRQFFLGLPVQNVPRTLQFI